MNSFRIKAYKYLLPLIPLAFLCIVVHFMTLSSYASESDSSENSHFIVVSLGDSYSAGEGIPEFYGQSTSIEESKKSPDWVAHRSQSAWPGLLYFPETNKTALSEFRGINWFFYAASGAEIKHLDNDFEKTIKNPDKHKKETKKLQAQIENAKQDVNPNDVDYVTITIGGNDAGFADIIASSVMFGRHLLPNRLYDMLNKVWINFDKENGIKSNLINAYYELCDTFPNAEILVAGYPKLLNPSGGFAISREETKLINTNISYFNNEIENIVYKLQKEGKKIHFISVEKAFEGSGAYSKKNSFINKIIIPPADQDIDLSAPNSAYSMHPNEYGALAYAACVQQTINSLEKGGPFEICSDNFELEVLDSNNNPAKDYSIQIEGRYLYSCEYPKIYFRSLVRMIPTVRRYHTVRIAYHTQGIGVDEYSETKEVDSPQKIKLKLEPGNYTVSVSSKSAPDKKVIKNIIVDPASSKKKIEVETDFVNIETAFYEKIRELEQEYGIAAKGVSRWLVNRDDYYTASTPYEDIVYDEGIILTDIFDYDNDNTPELLSIRRKNGKIGTTDNGELSYKKRSEYIFEMFEATDEGCKMSDHITLGVFDDLNWSIGASNMSIFKYETSKYNFICVETFISGQDHPHDTSIIKLYYDKEREGFSVVGGIRTGYWYSENGAWCMEPWASNVIDYLSSAAVSGFQYWEEIIRCESIDDYEYLAARDKKMKELGFTVLKTRLDVENANRKNLAQMDYNDEYLEALQKLTEKIAMTSADECYDPINGSITNMAFLYEYSIRDREDDILMVLVHSINSYIESVDIDSQEAMNDEIIKDEEKVESEDDEGTSTSAVEVTDEIYKMTAAEAAEFLGFHIRRLTGRRGHSLMFSMVETPSHPNTASMIFCSERDEENTIGEWYLDIADDTVSVYGAKIGMAKDHVQKLLNDANWEISNEQYWDGIEDNEIITNGTLCLTFSPKDTSSNAYKYGRIIEVCINVKTNEVESINILHKDDE